MKNCRFILACSLILCVLLNGCSLSEPRTKPDEPEEIRAVWISCFDLPSPDAMRSETAFCDMVKEMLENIRSAGFNTVFLHVRPFSDAIYRSSLFPYSACISGREGVDPGFDALEIFCDCAKKHELSLHAWINPFRICSASELDKKADANPAKRILLDDDPNNDKRVVNVKGTLYYDPASRENQELVLNGVREILQNYPVDGVHIDDYFYPTAEDFLDQKEYDDYLDAGGTLARGDWRRAQINTLVAGLYTCTKSFGQDKIFSISPAMDIAKNRETLYADVSRWASCEGYCDWLIPQVYVGFLHESMPFPEAVAQWRTLTRNEDVRLLIGLAAYKCGTEDPIAGSGRKEWIEHNDILSRQILYLRDFADCSGFALFSFTYIFGGKMSENSISEMKSVISVL